MKIGINGFGRIGRQLFRIAYELDGLEVFHINDVADPETLAYLLQFDTIYGRWPPPRPLHDEGEVLVIDDGTTVTVSTKKDPAQLPRLYFAKVLAWYDNEWAFSRRCVDMMQRMA